jgi:hypothetical protein
MVLWDSKIFAVFVCVWSSILVEAAGTVSLIATQHKAKMTMMAKIDDGKSENVSHGQARLQNKTNVISSFIIHHSILISSSLIHPPTVLSLRPYYPPTEVYTFVHEFSL